jgi:hypothetical protein
VSADAEKLLRDTLTLPDVEAAWAAEIARPAADARQHPDDDEDWREALDQVEREVLSR